jgi:membrane protease YdiL (CAAX protease family)
LVLAVFAAAVLAARPAAGSDPEWAATGSLLLPGLGQAINGDYGAGLVQVSLYLALANQYLILSEKPEYIKPTERADDATYTYRINRTTYVADFYGTALTDLSFYSSFAAYRDARRQPANRQGYTTPAPEESLGDLVAAPFRWEFLLRPGTLIPLLIPIYVLSQPVAKDQFVYQPDSTITRNEMAWGNFVQFNMVAVGEESFFRGVLNNGLSDWLGPTYGLLASSAIFGLGHSGQSGAATPLGAALYGLYLGWLQQENDYAIGQGVALHYWWDFLISLALLRRHEDQVVPLASVYLRF